MREKKIVVCRSSTVWKPLLIKARKEIFGEISTDMIENDEESMTDKTRGG